MIIGIQTDTTNCETYSEKWIEALHERNIIARRIDLLNGTGLSQISGLDGVMWRWLHTSHDKQSAYKLLFTIEHDLGIPIFPNLKTSWHYDDKVSQYYSLEAIAAPLPNTWVFWKREDALTWAGKTTYPVVFKLSSGAGASNVIRVDSERQANELIHRIFGKGIFPYTMNEFQPSKIPNTPSQLKALIIRFYEGLKFSFTSDFPSLPGTFWLPEKGYVYFQEFLHNNLFDTRITVIGNRAFGFRRWNREGDFRASGSGMIDFDPSLIDLHCVEIAYGISERCRYQSMAYDFLFKDGTPVITEMSYSFVDEAVYQCPGYWDKQLSWCEGQMWPQEAQVEDFIINLNPK
jgi:glutathione synthase/RimK-type ligase-like ATP-grasp enzyme